VIRIAVTVAISILVPKLAPVLSRLLPTFLSQSKLMLKVLSASTAALANNAAQQALSLQWGEQEGFNLDTLWQDLLLEAVTEGVGGVIDSLPVSSLSKSQSAFFKTLNRLPHTLTKEVVRQAVLIALDQERNLSWESFARALIKDSVGNLELGHNVVARAVLETSLKSLSNQLILGGQISVQAIMLETLGVGLGHLMAHPIENHLLNRRQSELMQDYSAYEQHQQGDIEEDQWEIVSWVELEQEASDLSADPVTQEHRSSEQAHGGNQAMVEAGDSHTWEATALTRNYRSQSAQIRMNQALLEGDVQAAFSAYVDRELTMSSEERAYREFVGEEDPWASYSSVDTSLLEPDPTEPSIASSFWEGMKSGFMSSVRFARDAGGMFLEAGMNHRPFASVVLDQTYTPQSEYTHRMMERGTNFVTSMAGLGTSFSETYLSSWGLNDTLGLPELSWEEKLLMATSPSLYFVNQGFFNTSAYDIAYGVGEIIGNPINYAPVGLAFRTTGRAARTINPRPLPNAYSNSYHQHGFFFGGENFKRETQVTLNISKAEARDLLRSGEFDLTPEQTAKSLRTLGGGRMDNVSIKLMKTGEIRIVTERSGAVSGYQRMSFEIDTQGNTNKIVQTAFDNSDSLVHQSPGEPKNNLYDVKKWNVLNY
jgi:hypothetical protein